MVLNNDQESSDLELDVRTAKPFSEMVPELDFIHQAGSRRVGQGQKQAVPGTPRKFSAIGA